MEQKTIEDYKREILHKFNVIENKKIAGYESELTSVSVRDACIYLCDKRIDKVDIEILNRFFNCHNNTQPNYREIINSLDKDKFKPIWQFLKGDTESPSKFRIELVAWLVDFNPRPYAKYLKKTLDDNEISEENDLELKETKKLDFDKKEDIVNSVNDLNIEFQKEETNNKIEVAVKSKVGFKITITLILTAMLFLVYSIAKSTHFISKDVEVIRKISTNELPDYLRTNQMLWKGTSNSGTMEYFTTSGKHPVTGKNLTLISKEEREEIIKEKEIIFKTKESKNDIELAEKTILNPSFKNRTNSKEMAIFVFGEDIQLNREVISQLQSSKFSNYNTTTNLVLPNEMNKIIKENLLSGNMIVLGNTLYRHTDYICVGNTNSTFRASTVNSQITICDLKLNITVYDSKGNRQKSLSKSNTYIGQGFTKQEAQKNAIKRIK